MKKLSIHTFLVLIFLISIAEARNNLLTYISNDNGNTWSQKITEIKNLSTKGAVDPSPILLKNGDIGAIIQDYVEKNKMSVVRDFCGHGIGSEFHQAPNVLHYGNHNSGPKLESGMCFTIEPMVNIGRPETKVLSDNWTAVTRDRSLSAQFEHTLAVTDDGFEIFTNSPKGFTKPPYY